MPSLTQWTWIGADAGRWWRTGKPDLLQSMWSQRVRDMTEKLNSKHKNVIKTNRVKPAPTIIQIPSETSCTVITSQICLILTTLKTTRLILRPSILWLKDHIHWFKWWWMKSPLWLPCSQIRCVNSGQEVSLFLLYTICISQRPPKQQIKPAKLVSKAGKKNYWEKMKSKQIFNRICKGVKCLPVSGTRSKVAVRRSRCHMLAAPGGLGSTLLTQADCPPGLPLPPFKWDRPKPQGSFLSPLQEVFTKGVAQPWSCGPVTTVHQGEVLAAAWLQDPFIPSCCFSVLPHVPHSKAVHVQ